MTCAHFGFGPGTPHIRRIGIGVAALAYAEMGCAVLPLTRGGKKPHRQLPWDAGNAGGDGVHHASRHPAQIIRWWETDPAANVGVATGSPSSAMIIDCDVKGASHGPAQFAGFLHSNGLPFPVAPWVFTPSGGVHLWLRVPAGARVPERPGILPGVDIKGDGGLIVAPPSMRLMTPLARAGETGDSGEVPVPYSWASGCLCEAPMAPEWMSGWLAAAPPSSAATGGELAGEAPGLDELTANGIPRGQRNDTMYRLACSRYRAHGTGPLGAGQVLGELREVWRAGDTTGMPWREVLIIAESARKFIVSSEGKEAQLRELWVRRLS